MWILIIVKLLLVELNVKADSIAYFFTVGFQLVSQLLAKLDCDLVVFSEIFEGWGSIVFYRPDDSSLTPLILKSLLVFLITSELMRQSTHFLK